MAAAETASKTKTIDAAVPGAAAFKDAVDKSMSAFTELNTHSQQNVEALMASATAAAKAAEAFGAQAMAYSKKSVEDGLAAARSMSTARSLQEVVELQTKFARSAMESYLAEMNKVTETFSQSMKDTVTPLNARVTAAVERFQAAR